MFGFGRRSNESTVLRKNRELCHNARDAYYACVDRVIEEGSNYDQQIPNPCKKLRKEFEANCKETWVRHFDKQREKEARIARELSQTINSTARTARGATAGEKQK